MGSDLREFCLRWNNHHNTLISVLDSLLERERLVDVTLAAEGQFINVHRIVLFACSQYFEELLSQLPDKQAVVFLKDVQFSDLKALVDYMYKGEVNVSQERLEIFLQTAEALKIKGLVDKQQHKKFTENLPEHFLPSRPKARMNGPKVSHVLPQQYPTSLDVPNVTNSPTEIESLPSPEVQIGDPTVNEEEGEGEEEEQEHELEPEQIEEGVMVAEMEPDDHFVSVYAKRDQNIDSEFGDDQFEATENWSSQDADDDFWNSSHEAHTTSATDVTLANHSSGGSESWTPNPDTNDTAGPSKSKRAKRKSFQHTISSTAASARGRGRGGRAQAVSNDKFEKLFTCPQCSRSYKRKDNLTAHLRYECGQDPQFSCPVCQHKFMHRRYIPKHMLRRHPTHYQEFVRLNPPVRKTPDDCKAID